MNKSIKLYTSIFFATLLMTQSACKKNFFDTQPDNELNIESIFTNRNQTEQYWGGLFTAIPDVWNQPFGEFWTAITDECDMSNQTATTIDAINNGAINSTTTTNLTTAQYYPKIRQCGIFLDNVDKNQELLNSASGAYEVARMKAEARFLRAFYYWRIMQIHGPTPILPEDTKLPTDNYQVPRTPVDLAISWLLSELDLAAADLPEEIYQSGTITADPTQTGRINRMIVEALKSQILLYHASPLFNGNKDYANFKNLDGTALFNQTYDALRWEKAATAAKSAIDMAERNGKELFQVADANPFRAAFLSSRNLYWDGWRKEGIWIRPASGTRNWELRTSPRSTAGTAYSYMGVTQEFVDGFRMASGMTINQDPAYTESGFTTAGNEYYVTGTSKMYQGREPRFYAFVTFNGSMIPGAPKAGMTRVEFYNTGNSGKAGAPRDWSKTGYTIRKNIHPTFSVTPAVNVARPSMYIRLAELYLNYVEALNESDPTNTDILKYLNAIRQRGGIPPIAAGSMGQDQMREAIRKERQIELAFENHRYFDVRRWKIADKPGYYQGGTYTGMDVSKGTTLSDVGFHTRTAAVRRATWNNRFYFLPFLQSEMDRNKQLVQLPGY